MGVFEERNDNNVKDGEDSLATDNTDMMERVEDRLGRLDTKRESKKSEKKLRTSLKPLEYDEELRNVGCTEVVGTDRVDIYSIGILVVDLFHPNCCGQERYPLITPLRDTKKLPPSLHDECPIVHDMLGRLLSQNADERPSAKGLFEVLK